MELEKDDENSENDKEKTEFLLLTSDMIQFFESI